MSAVYCTDCDMDGVPLVDGRCAQCRRRLVRAWRRIRSAATELWYRRPVLTTYQRRIDDAADSYAQGYAAGHEQRERAEVPESVEVRKHAERVTSTGQRLAAVGL